MKSDYVKFEFFFFISFHSTNLSSSSSIFLLLTKGAFLSLSLFIRNELHSKEIKSKTLKWKIAFSLLSFQTHKNLNNTMATLPFLMDPQLAENFSILH
jgi:hypothetical protein